MECLQAYIIATAQFRTSQDHEQIFLSAVFNDRKVDQTLLQILEKSGVDTNTFSAHSTRGAASTAATMGGMSAAQIMDGPHKIHSANTTILPQRQTMRSNLDRQS